MRYAIFFSLMKFQNCILINFVTDARTDGRTDKPKAICPFNFSKVGGIKNEMIIPCRNALLCSGMQLIRTHRAHLRIVKL